MKTYRAKSEQSKELHREGVRRYGKGKRAKALKLNYEEINKILGGFV